MIAKSKQRRRFAKSLEVGLREAVLFARGELTLRTIVVPDPPPKVAGREVASLRPNRHFPGRSCPRAECVDEDGSELGARGAKTIERLAADAASIPREPEFRFQSRGSFGGKAGLCRFFRGKCRVLAISGSRSCPSACRQRIPESCGHESTRHGRSRSIPQRERGRVGTS